MSTPAAPEPPLPGARVLDATGGDAPELLVLQRCCWVEEAIANDTLEIPPLYESVDDVRAWLREWSTWCVRVDARLVGAVRARRDGSAWEIGRLMVAPDLWGKGLGRYLLGLAEAHAPVDVAELTLFTGARNARNIRFYEAAGYRRSGVPAPPHAVMLSKRRQT
jgi:GNAT superfamily N-acetyltransferase